MGAFIFNLVFCVTIILAAVPLTIYGARLVKKYRKTASAAATLLLVFGIGMRVAPPPPPTVEATEREVAAVKDDEPE